MEGTEQSVSIGEIGKKRSEKLYLVKVTVTLTFGFSLERTK